MADFHYSGQIRRFMLQFARIFSNFYVTNGKDPNGNDILLRIPIKPGASSRQVAAVVNNNSASTLPSAPQLSFYISGLEYNQKWLQDPTFVDHMQVRQRTYNPTTHSFEPTQAQAFTIERIMPAPYTLRMTLELWTTNENQKQEFIEQVAYIFNPALEIQNTDNYMDWTSLSTVFQDGLNYSSRTIPVGTANPIDVLSWKFYMPIWITPPAKLKKMGVIYKVITSLNDGSTIDDIQADDLLLGTRQKIAPFGYKLLMVGNKLQLLPEASAFYPSNNSLEEPNNPTTSVFWTALLESYGVITPGVSQIWLDNEYMTTPIVGTITIDPLDDRFLIYDIDPTTLPSNTLAPVTAVIDPLLSGPGSGLPVAVTGTRYLILNDLGSPNNSTVAWGAVNAKENDIIEFDGVQWNVSFNSGAATENQYVLNMTSSLQYRYVPNEATWMKSVDGFYNSGSFSVVI